MPNASCATELELLVQKILSSNVCFIDAIKVRGAAPNVDTAINVAPNNQGLHAAILPIYLKSCLCLATSTNNPINTKESAFKRPWHEKYVITVI